MDKKLRIAQLVLPWIPLPPPTYAGTERVVYNLVEQLVKKGHEVTLFSVAESKTSARLEYILEKALGLQQDVMGMLKGSFYPLAHVANCFEKADRFDIIHSHAQFLGLPFAAIAKTPSVHTFHRIFEFASSDEKDLVYRYKHLNYISISNSQRIEGLNFISTVYNGIDIQRYIMIDSTKKDYLLWAGRLIDKKGPREAIEVAKKTGMVLVMAGKTTEVEFFQKYIEGELDGEQVKFVGDVSEKEMIHLYQNAYATLAPVKWNEPFGLIPVESMACGTPVVAFANGGVVETIKDGQTGFLVPEEKGVNGLVEAVARIGEIDRNTCRQHVVDNFSVEKMADGYEMAYRKVLEME